MDEQLRRFADGARKVQAVVAAAGFAPPPVVWKRPAWSPEDATWVSVELGATPADTTIVVEFDDRVGHRIDVDSAEQLAQRILEAVAAARARK